jgi:hypothetical protein
MTTAHVSMATALPFVTGCVILAQLTTTTVHDRPSGSRPHAITITWITTREGPPILRSLKGDGNIRLLIERDDLSYWAGTCLLSSCVVTAQHNGAALLAVTRTWTATGGYEGHCVGTQAKRTRIAPGARATRNEGLHSARSHKQGQKENGLERWDGTRENVRRQEVTTAMRHEHLVKWQTHCSPWRHGLVQMWLA